MSKLLRTIGRVEIRADEYTDAQLKITTANAIQFPLKDLPPEASRSEYVRKYVAPINLLTRAIPLAPIMGRVALGRIRKLLASAGTPKAPDFHSDLSLFNTELSLFKYFNLPYDLRDRPTSDPAWQTLGKIATIFDRTVKGLSDPYRIYLYEPQNFESKTVDALGFVRHEHIEEGRHPLDIYFRTPADENGHVPHPHWLETGHIHIRMDALTGQKANDASVARLLFHEATHKWASTKDICYKWDTISQRTKHQEWNKAMEYWKTEKAKDLRWAIDKKAQPAKYFSVKAKPVMPMSKYGVTIDQWVLNADSYAWTAYRLHKKAGFEASIQEWPD